MPRFYHPDNPPEHQRMFRQPEENRQSAYAPPSAYEEAVYDDDFPQEETAWEEQPLYEEEMYDDEAYLDTEDYYLPEEELLTEEELAEMRRERWHMLAHLWDFLSVIAGGVVILLLVALLISLMNWLYADVSQTFTLWQTKL